MNSPSELRIAVVVGLLSAAFALLFVTEAPSFVFAAAIGFYCGCVGTLALHAWRRIANACFVRWLSASFFLAGSLSAMHFGISVSVFAHAKHSTGVGWLELWFRHGGLSDVACLGVTIVAWVLAARLAGMLPLRHRERKEN